ncbi:hypothetical protein AJ79_01781 [Helicocarpus griseus UAMH5409]|uniref:Uncharacterized protein n=1 Tax=Helicocarpus griseus UAMH5409 TaxID=1447875 RepID=A0A2B7Y5F0_9EURO|nr:hypothetical protein AJ79_01781 [Helicocarpus griseus UAMH5409]
MQCSHLDLGSSIQIFGDRHIKARAAASAEVLFPESTAYLDPRSLFEAIKTRDSWVSSTPHLQFIVSVLIEGSLYKTLGARNDIFSEIKDALIDSKLWHALQLSRISNNEGFMTVQEGLHHLKITFEFQRNSAQLPLKPPRMPYTLEPGPLVTEPPPDVLRIRVQEINITVNFSPYLSGKDSKGTVCKNTRNGSLEDATTRLPPELLPWPDDACYSSISGSQTTTRSDDSWMSLDDDSPFSSQQTFSELQSSVVVSHKTELQHISKPTCHPFLALLDSGIRTLICQVPPRISPNITTIAENPGLSLSEFAPDLFNPGYDTHISQRARFIPMISKGIAAILDNVPCSVESQLKRTLLNKTHARKACDPCRKGPLDQIKTRQSIKALLWKSMQRGLVTSDATRKLPSLAMSERPPLRPENDDGILDNATNPILLSSRAMATARTHSNNSQSLHTVNFSDTDWCFAEDSDDDDVLLVNDAKHDDEAGDFFADPFQIETQYVASIISNGHDNNLLDDFPNPPCPLHASPPNSILDDYLDMPEEEPSLCISSPHISFLPNQPKSTTRTATARMTSAPPIIAPSSPTSGMEILDPSSPLTIPLSDEEVMLSPAFPATNTIHVDVDPANAFTASLPQRLPNHDVGENGDQDANADEEMLLL